MQLCWAIVKHADIYAITTELLAIRLPQMPVRFSAYITLTTGILTKPGIPTGHHSRNVTSHWVCLELASKKMPKMFNNRGGIWLEKKIKIWLPNRNYFQRKRTQPINESLRKLWRHIK